MRLKQSRLYTKYLRTRTVQKDNEGGTSITWGTAKPFECEVWTEISRDIQNTYGRTLEGDFYMYLNGDYSVSHEGNHEVYTFPTFSLRVGDGVCLYASSLQEPDMVINGVAPYPNLLISLVRNI